MSTVKRFKRLAEESRRIRNMPKIDTSVAFRAAVYPDSDKISQIEIGRLRDSDRIRLSTVPEGKIRRR